MRRLDPKAAGGSRCRRSRIERSSRPREREICSSNGRSSGGASGGNSGRRCRSARGLVIGDGVPTRRYHGREEEASFSEAGCPGSSSGASSISSSAIADCGATSERRGLRRVKRRCGTKVFWTRRLGMGEVSGGLGLLAKVAQASRRAWRQLGHWRASELICEVIIVVQRSPAGNICARSLRASQTRCR